MVDERSAISAARGTISTATRPGCFSVLLMPVRRRPRQRRQPRRRQGRPKRSGSRRRSSAERTTPSAALRPIVLTLVLSSIRDKAGRGEARLHYQKIPVVMALLAPILSACATPQGMTAAGGIAGSSNPKYRNAIAVRSVSGGEVMNMATVPGIPNEPLKIALESSLAANGYLSKSGTPKFYLDVVIQELHLPMHGLTLHATADVTYALTGSGAFAPYHIVTTGRATFSDSAIAVARMRFANERAMRENIEQFLRELR